MPFSYRTLSLPLAFALVLFGAAGCASWNDSFDNAVQNIPPPILGLSPVIPPQPKPEVAPVLQHPREEVWRPGHWEYEKDQFIWTPGEILQRPNPTAVWSPDVWQHRAYGWVFVPGFWQ